MLVPLTSSLAKAASKQATLVGLFDLPVPGLRIHAAGQCQLNAAIYRRKRAGLAGDFRRRLVLAGPGLGAYRADVDVIPS